MAKTLAKTEVYNEFYNETFSIELTYIEGLDNGNDWDGPYHIKEILANDVYYRDFKSHEEAAKAFEASSRWLIKSNVKA